jgi:hypothetical protein
MKKLSFKGIIWGSITDIVASNIAAIPLFIYVSIAIHASALPKAEIGSAVANAIQGNILYFSLGTISGGLCSILGGYVAARIARHDEVLNGALAAFLCVGGGIYSMITGNTHSPWWESVLFLLLSPSLTAFGGYLRLRQVRRTPALT